MIRNYNAILDDVRKIRFWGLKELGDIAPCFYAPSRYLDESVEWKEMFQKIGNIRDKVCRYNVRCKGKKKVLFLFSACYAGRRDYKKAFTNVTGLFDDKIVVTPNKKCLAKTPGAFLLGAVWMIQMSKVKTSMKNKLMYIYELLVAYYNYLQIRDVINQNRKSIKMVFTYTDMHNIDSLVTMYANRLGIKTVTLQHGAINTNIKIRGTDADSSGAFTMSKSRYMLMYGSQSVSYGKQLGINEKKLISVGCAKNINDVCGNGLKQATQGVFAIVLDGRCQYNDEEICVNQGMITMGELLAEKYDMQFWVRRHPSDRYRYKIKSDKFMGYNSNKTDISKLVQDIDFVVMGNSTAYCEFVYFMLPAFRYKYSDYDPYNEIKWDSFKKYEELENLVGLLMNNPEKVNYQMLETREYLYQKGDVKKNFVAFFEKHVKE